MKWDSMWKLKGWSIDSQGYDWVRLTRRHDQSRKTITLPPLVVELIKRKHEYGRQEALREVRIAIGAAPV